MEHSYDQARNGSTLHFLSKDIWRLTWAACDMSLSIEGQKCPELTALSLTHTQHVTSPEATSSAWEEFTCLETQTNSPNGEKRN